MLTQIIAWIILILAPVVICYCLYEAISTHRALKRIQVDRVIIEKIAAMLERDGNG